MPTRASTSRGPHEGARVQGAGRVAGGGLPAPSTGAGLTVAGRAAPPTVKAKRWERVPSEASCSACSRATCETRPYNHVQQHNGPKARRQGGQPKVGCARARQRKERERERERRGRGGWARNLRPQVLQLGPQVLDGPKGCTGVQGAALGTPTQLLDALHN